MSRPTSSAQIMVILATGILLLLAPAAMGSDIFAPFVLDLRYATLDADGDGLWLGDEPDHGCDPLVADAALYATIETPSDGAARRTAPIVITGRVSSPLVETVLLSVDNGVNYALEADLTGLAWSFSFTPPSTGTYVIRARALNVFGGFSDSAPVAFSYNSIYPEVELLDPMPGEHITGMVSVTGTVLASVQAEVDEWTLECRPGWDATGTEGWTTLRTALVEVARDGVLHDAWQTSLLPEGPYTLRLRVSAAGGFLNFATHRYLTVTRDRTSPAAPSGLTFLGVVAPGHVKDGSETTLRGTTEPGAVLDRAELLDASGLTLLDVTNNMVVHQNGEIWGSIDMPDPLVTEWVSVCLSVRDAAGNLSAFGQSNALAVDNQAPSLTISTPPPPVTLPLALFPVSGTADDGTGSGVEFVQFSTDGNIWHLATGTSNWSRGWTPPAEGPGTLHIRARDRLGNTTVETLEVLVNSVYPTAYITTPLPGELINAGAQVAVTGTASDTDFSQYKLRRAPGVSPGSGYADVTGFITTPVVEGPLGT